MKPGERTLEERKKSAMNMSEGWTEEATKWRQLASDQVRFSEGYIAMVRRAITCQNNADTWRGKALEADR